MTKTVYVIIYSAYGHVKTLGEKIVEGLKSVDINAKLYQVPEILPTEVLKKMNVAKFDIPVITPEDLPKADGFIMGFPTRFGQLPAQFKACWDATGGLWSKGELVGKYCGFFTSSATQHGGQETTILTSIPMIAHHGMLYVPLGFTNPKLFDNSALSGGTPWGATTIANGDGSRQPSEAELDIAKHQGVHFGTLLKKVH